MTGRRVSPELMDRPDLDRRELARSLEDLRAVNRWLGGRRAVLRRLSAPIQRRARAGPVTLLDVGTGSADLPLLLTRWAREQGITLSVVALDFHAHTSAVAAAATASDPAVRVVRANALALPLPDASMDLAVSSTMLHHFEEAEAAQVLREMNRVARWGILVSDIRRSAAALMGAHLLARTLWRSHPITRHDGPLSVEAAFDPDELRELATMAGLEGAEVRSEPIFRLSLLLDRTRDP